MGGKALAQFMGLDKGTISSFAELVEFFCKNQDSGRRDEWISHVKNVKDRFSKESKNKYQSEATIFRSLTDDILSTIDEASQADEYDDGPVYDDPQVLIEEAEEQKDRMSPPFQHTETHWDILDLWKHNDENSEEDDYWKCMGPPLYDS